MRHGPTTRLAGALAAAALLLGGAACSDDPNSVAAQAKGLSPHKSFLRVKKVNETFLKRDARLLDFSGELKKISAIDEYQALDDVFEKRLGGASGSPSASSSAS